MPNENVSKRIYRNGNLVEACLPGKAQRPHGLTAYATMSGDQRKEHQARRAVTAWCTPTLQRRLLKKAFDAVYRYQLPPAGEPFFDADGQPYSTREEFAEQLADEFRERLFEYLGIRDNDELSGGRAYLLGEPDSTRVPGYEGLQ